MWITPPPTLCSSQVAAQVPSNHAPAARTSPAQVLYGLNCIFISMRPPDASSQLSDFLCFSRHQPSRIPRAPPCRDSTTTHEQGQPRLNTEFACSVHIIILTPRGLPCGAIPCHLPHRGILWLGYCHLAKPGASTVADWHVTRHGISDCCDSVTCSILRHQACDTMPGTLFRPTFAYVSVACTGSFD